MTSYGKVPNIQVLLLTIDMTDRINLDSSFLMNETPSSIHALKAALSTMKDRCQNLQNRLSALEDENLQLRIERHSIPGIYKKEPDGNPELTSLNRKCEELSRLKSKLSHHIFMVARENKNLWEKLYNISDCCDHNDSQRMNALKPTRSLRIAEISTDDKEGSLEEISLKGSLEDKTVHQSKQENTKVKGCEFTLSDISEDESLQNEEVTMLEMNDILNKLNLQKQILLQNQEVLRTALNNVTEYISDNIPCRECIRKQEFTEAAQMEVEDEKNKSTGETLNVCHGVPKENFQDRICPLCAKFYSKNTPFDEFNDHVLTHFVEDTDQDSHLSLYEVTA